MLTLLTFPLHAVLFSIAEYIDHSKHDPEKVVEVSPNGRYAKVRSRTHSIRATSTPMVHGRVAMGE